MEKMKKKDLEDTRRKMELKIKLDTMEADSARWPTLLDMNQKLDENVILPSTIMNYGEY